MTAYEGFRNTYKSMPNGSSTQENNTNTSQRAGQVSHLMTSVLGVGKIVSDGQTHCLVMYAGLSPARAEDFKHRLVVSEALCKYG